MTTNSVRTEFANGTTLVPRSGGGVARPLVASAFRRKVCARGPALRSFYTWLCTLTAAAFHDDTNSVRTEFADATTLVPS